MNKIQSIVAMDKLDCEVNNAIADMVSTEAEEDIASGVLTFGCKDISSINQKLLINCRDRIDAGDDEDNFDEVIEDYTGFRDMILGDVPVNEIVDEYIDFLPTE